MPLTPRARFVGVMVGVALATHLVVVLAFPSVLMRVVLSAIGERAGTNRAYAAERPDHTFRSIVRPSPDLLYSVCVLDLPDETSVVEVEAELPTSYGSLAVYDAQTDVVDVLGDRDTNGHPARLVIARAGARLDPDRDVHVVRLPSRRGLLLQRVLVPDESSLSVVDARRRTLRCTPRTLDPR